MLIVDAQVHIWGAETPGRPWPPGDQARTHRKLAGHPNIVAKASPFPRYSSEAYPYPKLHPYLRQVFDAFGPKRMFWGTDLTGIPCTYRQAIAMFTEELPWLRGEDLEWVMGRGVCEWLGWPLPS